MPMAGLGRLARGREFGQFDPVACRFRDMIRGGIIMACQKRAIAAGVIHCGLFVHIPKSRTHICQLCDMV